MRYGAFLGLALGALSIGSIPSLGMASLDRVAIVPSTPNASKPAKRVRSSTKHPRNGKREVARRLRQIAAGQLTRSNGLVTADELYGRKAA